MRRRINTPRTGKQAVRDAARTELDKALTAQSGTYNFEDGNPVEGLADELLNTGGDHGGELVKALDETWDNTQDNEARLDGLLRTVTAEDGTEMEAGRIVDIENSIVGLTGGDDGGTVNQLRTDLDALTAMDDPETMEDETGAVTRNADDITNLDGRVGINEGDIDDLEIALFGETSS